mgnify:CR=1 FL=1
MLHDDHGQYRGENKDEGRAGDGRFDLVANQHLSVQMVGQAMWSAAHLAMVGSSFNALTSALLVGHHLFACWNGDRRLRDEHGAAFDAVAERTSVVPFAAILDGRQTLPPDYWKELVRAPYALIAVGTLGAYAAHPYMQAGAALVRNTGLVEGGILDGLFQ